MLGQRRRRWPNIKSALDRCLFAGMGRYKKHVSQQKQFFDPIIDLMLAHRR